MCYDEWLTTEPEPPRRHYSGTCPQCHTEHFYGRGNSFDTNPCASCDRKVCDECPTCTGCGSAVCHVCQAHDQGQIFCRDCFVEYCDAIAAGVYKAGPGFCRDEVERRLATLVTAFARLDAEVAQPVSPDAALAAATEEEVGF
jgi:hypothetical protein